VISMEPAVSTAMMNHVKTSVALIFKKPDCQKMIASGLRRMNYLLFRETFLPQKICPSQNKASGEKNS